MNRMLERMLGSDMKDERVRSAWGKAASATGVAANALLFALKLLVGALSGSVAITADAMNNLSDASSSVVSLLGFKLAEKPADAEHPYGHGRFEYLSGLMVAVMILVIGVELMKGSVEKIFSPTPVVLSGATALVLAGSIAVKLWLAAFNCGIGRRIGSKTLEATADNSRNDVIATGAVLLSMIVGHFTGLTLDGFMGAAVAAFILFSGFGLVRDTIDPMLGSMPSREMVEGVRARLLSYPGVLGIHDLMVHDYGPGRQFASVHLELDAKQDPLAAHDLIDNIERDFLMRDKLHLVIHYDPVVTDDPRVAAMKGEIASIARAIDSRLTIHDLRLVPGNTHTNVVFDCVAPYQLKQSTAEVKARIAGEVSARHPDCFCVITMEHSFAMADA